MNTIKDIFLPDGTVIPAGKTIKVSEENTLTIDGKVLDLYKIPTDAFESCADKSTLKGLAFDNIKTGDTGYNKQGFPITVIEKIDNTANIDVLSIADKYAATLSDDLGDVIEAGQYLIVSDDSSCKVIKYEDALIFRLDKVDYHDIVPGSSLLVGSEHVLVLAKHYSHKRFPDWQIHANESVDFKNKKLILVKTNKGLKVIDYDAI